MNRSGQAEAAIFWKAAAILPLIFSLACCGFVDDEVVDGPYRLVAIDTRDQMSLCYSDGKDCIGRVDETVFAVGWNSSYVVAARHPHVLGNGMRIDKSVAEYFYVVRALDGLDADPSKSVRGPFTATEFGVERQRLGLPQFSKFVEGLR